MFLRHNACVAGQKSVLLSSYAISTEITYSVDYDSIKRLDRENEKLLNLIDRIQYILMK